MMQPKLLDWTAFGKFSGPWTRPVLGLLGLGPSAVLGLPFVIPIGPVQRKVHMVQLVIMNTFSGLIFSYVFGFDITC